MDKDKLNEAAKHFAAWETINSSDPNNNYYCKWGFIKGAQWLMQQPLANRLTDEEKEKIRNYHRVLTRDKHVAICNRSYSGQAGADAMLFSLEQIFGEELFDEK